MDEKHLGSVLLNPSGRRERVQCCSGQRVTALPRTSCNRAACLERNRFSILITNAQNELSHRSNAIHHTKAGPRSKGDLGCGLLSRGRGTQQARAYPDLDLRSYVIRKRYPLGQAARGNEISVRTAVGFEERIRMQNKLGAGGRTRTDTHVSATDFESVVYTNFTTPASGHYSNHPDAPPHLGSTLENQ